MSIERIIDANGNRAREALRVMEEAARFIVADADLTRALKTLRHDLVDVLASLDAVTFHRDVAGDPGTDVTTARERSRDSAADVVRAAAKRLGEALRAIEEYGKTIDDAWAARVEQLRYRAYELEQRLDLALGGGTRRQWPLCVILSETLCPGGDWERVARLCLEKSVASIQLREKSLDDAELLRRARALVAMAAVESGGETAIIVNDRPDIAMLAGAHGVHVGQGDLPCAEVRRLVGRRLLVGVSTSCLAEAKTAQRDGADYCGVGPMFTTTTKRKNVIVGPAYLAEYLAWDGLPHLAVGGITPDNVGELAATGCRGIAVSAAVCGADDPAAAIERLPLEARFIVGRKR